MRVTPIPRELISHLGASDNAHITKPGFYVDELENAYTIAPVSYDNGAYCISLSKRLLDEGRIHTQDEWVDLLQESEWSLPSGPITMALLTTLYQERDGSYKNTIQKIADQFRMDLYRWPITSTRIAYFPALLDVVTHEYGTLDQYHKDAHISGPDMLVTPGPDSEDIYNVLLGMRDPQLIEKVAGWLYPKNIFIERRKNTLPNSSVQTLAFGTYGSSLIIGATGELYENQPARGVIVERIP